MRSPRRRKAPVSADLCAAARTDLLRRDRGRTAAAVVSVYEPEIPGQRRHGGKAYDLLEANGYIRHCQGSGCYVLPLDNFKFFADGVVLDSFQAGQSEPGPVYDFATSTPLATREETRQFVALADELAQQRPDALLRYPPTRRRCGSVWPRAAFAAPELCRLPAGADTGRDTLYRLGNRLAAGAPSGVGNLVEVSCCIFCEQT